MAPARGNKWAVGNPNSGRPCKFDKEAEFKALEEWAKTDEALVFRMFPCMRGYSHDTLENWAIENDVFLDIYNVALETVGARRELILIKNISPSPFQRYATYYDKKLRKHERDEKEFDSALKQKEEGSKATTINLQVPNDLAAGLNLPTKTVSSKNNSSSK
jgi:hypothetical protein